MSFENSVRNSLAALSNDMGMNVVVDEIEAFPIHGANSLLVEFHLEGNGVTPARFTFPFAETVPMEATTGALRDLIERNWKTAHIPPPVSASIVPNSGTAGGI